MLQSEIRTRRRRINGQTKPGSLKYDIPFAIDYEVKNYVAKTNYPCVSFSLLSESPVKEYSLQIFMDHTTHTLVRIKDAGCIIFVT